MTLSFYKKKNYNNSERQFDDRTSYRGDKSIKKEIIKIANANRFNLDHEALAMLSVTNSMNVSRVDIITIIYIITKLVLLLLF